MGTVMIQCPVTRQPISTGIVADQRTFAASPVFLAASDCPHCKTQHQWFAGDAWVEERAPAKPAHAA